MGCEIVAIIIVGGGLFGSALWIEATFFAPLLSWIAGFDVLHSSWGGGTDQFLCHLGTTGAVFVNVLGVLWILSSVCWVLGFPAAAISLLAVFHEDRPRRTGVLFAVTIVSFIVSGLILRLLHPFGCTW